MRSNLPQHGCDDKCDYIAGDVVVLAQPVTIQGCAADTDKLLTILSIDEFCGGLQVEVNGKHVYADASELRSTTTAELKAKRRRQHCSFPIGGWMIWPVLRSWVRGSGWGVK